MLRPAYALLAVLTLAGCDAATGPEPDPPTASLKLRNWHLLDHGIEPGQAAVLGDSVEMIVTFAPSVADPVAASDIVFAVQEVVKRDYYRDSFTGVAITVSAEEFDRVLDDLVASALVSYVEPDLEVAPRNESPTYVPLSNNWDGDAGDQYPSQPSGGQVLPWNIEKIKGNDSSTRSGNGSGSVNVDVYVIDTDVTHSDITVVERRSFLPEGASPATAVHGNHVAGTLAAVDDGDGMAGVAPGARVHALQVVEADGTCQLSSLLAAVEYVTSEKRANPTRPMVVNFSIGAYVGTTQLNALDEAIQASVAAGVVYVVSAGNQAVNASLYSPAHVPEVITVGAYDSQKVFARDFSNYGSMVDILAPGVRVVSAADGGNWALLTGTSMATPHVTGAVALILSRNPTWTPSRVRTEVINKGKDGEVNNTPSGTTRRTVWLEHI